MDLMLSFQKISLSHLQCMKIQHEFECTEYNANRYCIPGLSFINQSFCCGFSTYMASYTCRKYISKSTGKWRIPTLGNNIEYRHPINYRLPYCHFYSTHVIFTTFLSIFVLNFHKAGAE